MPHTPGPYVYLPRENPPNSGFAIYAAKMPIATVPPIGLVPTNKRGREEVEANARLFSASPVMFLALQAVILDTSIDVTVRDLAQHAIDMATKGTG